MKRDHTGMETYYTGNMVYEGSVLKYILHGEGKYIVDGGTSEYQYDLKDHLGNVRMVVGQTGDEKQQSAFYPFGMAFQNGGSSDNKYLYNGKEMQDDVIGGGNLDWYDYGARFYDASLGRWHCIDPLAEEAHNVSFSPYNYCINNPIIFIDPDGMDWFYNDQTGDVFYNEGLRKGAEKEMSEGWRHMGANNMFSNGNTDTEDSNILEDNKNLMEEGSYKTERKDDKNGGYTLSTSARFKGENAKKMMGGLGFDFKPTQQIIYSNETKWPQQSGATFITGELTKITEKSSYILKGSIENSKTFMSAPNMRSLGTEVVGRYQITYTSNLLKKTINFIDQNIGNHDMRIPTVYPNLKAYPKNNKQINIFIKQQ